MPTQAAALPPWHPGHMLPQLARRQLVTCDVTHATGGASPHISQAARLSSHDVSQPASLSSHQRAHAAAAAGSSTAQLATARTTCMACAEISWGQHDRLGNDWLGTIQCSAAAAQHSRRRPGHPPTATAPPPPP